MKIMLEKMTVKRRSLIIRLAVLLLSLLGSVVLFVVADNVENTGRYHERCAREYHSKLPDKTLSESERQELQQEFIYELMLSREYDTSAGLCGIAAVFIFSIGLMALLSGVCLLLPTRYCKKMLWMCDLSLSGLLVLTPLGMVVYGVLMLVAKEEILIWPVVLASVLLSALFVSRGRSYRRCSILEWLGSKRGWILLSYVIFISLFYLCTLSLQDVTRPAPFGKMNDLFDPSNFTACELACDFGFQILLGFGITLWVCGWSIVLSMLFSWSTESGTTFWHNFMTAPEGSNPFQIFFKLLKRNKVLAIIIFGVIWLTVVIIYAVDKISSACRERAESAHCAQLSVEQQVRHGQTIDKSDQNDVIRENDESQQACNRIIQEFKRDQQRQIELMMQQNMMMDSGSFAPMPSGGSSFSTPRMNTKRYCPTHGEGDTRGGTFSCPGCMAPKYGF